MNIKKDIDKLLTDMSDLRKVLEGELALCPPGTLQCYRVRGRLQYNQVFYISGKRVRHGINRNTEKLRALARKLYLQKCIEICDNNLLFLSKVSGSIIDYDPERILHSIESSVPNLPREYYLAPIKQVDAVRDELPERFGEARKWAAEFYERSRYRHDQLRVQTDRGLKVRSKSEALIINLLDKYDVPFRYEQVLLVNGSYLIPDLSFLGSDKKEIYWEHAGLLDNPVYSFRHHAKMMQYESLGYYPWQGLIVTYDTDNELNMKMIDSVIKNVLIPAL